MKGLSLGRGVCVARNAQMNVRHPTLSNHHGVAVVGTFGDRLPPRLVWITNVCHVSSRFGTQTTSIYCVLHYCIPSTFLKAHTWIICWRCLTIQYQQVMAASSNIWFYIRRDFGEEEINKRNKSIATSSSRNSINVSAYSYTSNLTIWR